jgi:signal transduction histidine kinase/ActR/RegA family two-component response regulator
VDGVDWRARLSRRAVQVLAAASVIGVTLIHFTEPSAHLLTATHWYFLPVAVLLCAATFIRKGGWRWRARIAIGGVLALGCAGTATVGLLGGPAVVLCVALLLSALLLGRKATWATLTLMVLGVALIAFAMVTGRIAAPAPTDVSFARVQPWLRSGAMALMMLAVIAMTVAVVIENLEAALARAQSEITARERAELERAQALRIALEAQKLETVGRLAASVAHDFNNALCVIDMCNQQLARPSPGSDQSALREMIGQAVTQASSLARQLLLLARKHVPAPRRIALRAFVAELGGTLPRILPADVQVQIEAGDDALVFVDRVQLQHALLNLAMNARDAMPHGGRLRLRAHTVRLSEPLPAISGTLLPGSWAVFEVEDTGTGMDELTRAHAFEPLFTTKPVGHGTGLGLSSVLTAMELSAGYVTLWTERGVGTRVTLWLPVVGAGPADASPALEAAPIDLSGRTVLVVEDTASVLQLVREVLVGAGCTVLTASDGSEALRRLEEHRGPLDVLCTDVVMPGAPVRQVLARFSELHPGAPILIVSGYVADELALRGIAEGRYRQLPKPFTVNELLHTVGELTRPKAARSDHS